MEPKSYENANISPGDIVVETPTGDLVRNSDGYASLWGSDYMAKEGLKLLGVCPGHRIRRVGELPHRVRDVYGLWWFQRDRDEGRPMPRCARLV